MLEGILIGLTTALTPMNLGFVVAGCLVGTFIGMLPGLGPMSAIALMIPVAAGLDPAAGIILMAAVYYGAIFGGSTSSILINAPGVASTVATSFDGYPMAKQGKAGKALAIAAYSSFSGGVVGAILLLIAAPFLAKVSLSFHSTDYFALMVLGLTAVAAFAGQGNVLKAMLMTIVGLMLSTVGTDQTQGIQRFTLGMIDLLDGVSFLLLVMATFALSEALMAILKPKDDESRLKEKEDSAPNSVFNHQFIEEKTADLESLLEDLDSYSIDELLPQTGLDLSEIKKATELIINNDKIIICWAMGLTQHKNGVDNIREIVNILLLKGSIGKKGAGTCPVRGHSNVQGDRTMGIWEKPKTAFLDNLEKEFNFKAPRKHGLDVVDAIEAMHQNKAKVFFGMGGNFISATPDTTFTAKALRNCNLTVQVSTKLNRSHLIHGKQALILPCLGRSEVDEQETGEQFISVENSMGVVHKSNGHLKPLSEHLLSEPAIVAGIAEATLKNSKVEWSKSITNYDFIRDKIEATIPG
ncbi:tripartite tricarboxylate transporter permease, partial [uncultured Maritalea sp.]|uniref:tripartite tricarboxylate transporter permease n=1 Tax=uncultured Maritalea sp. TaxID=757249 RepID=UPI002617D1DA